MITELPQKTPRFLCNNCDFKTNNKKDYSRHILTSKHLEMSKMITQSGEKPIFTPILPQTQKYVCVCGNEYKYNSGLCRHKQKCNNINNNEITVDTNSDSDSDSDTESKTNLDNDKTNPDLSKKDNLIKYLIDENKEFKNLIMELIKKDFTNNNSNNTNNTINNVNSNNSFNLNVFLNEKCKGAMNMSEFVDTIKMQLSDLENFAHVDYADGVSNILLKNLNKLDTYLRPIHCSDLKRETVYIKENDCWTKEEDDKPNLKKAIKQIAFKNIKQINEWVKENPGCQDPRAKKNVKYNKIVMNSMSGVTVEEQQENIEKIVKNVTKAVTIDKYSTVK
uniref:C2H2-type domain-containing protein n=1 Tax=viral metagenome TaxID=1070528 RepID=A0A6C0I7B4_9ZZZZ